jgi:hypothetical protein
VEKEYPHFLFPEGKVPMIRHELSGSVPLLSAPHFPSTLCLSAIDFIPQHSWKMLCPVLSMFHPTLAKQNSWTLSKLQTIVLKD